MPVLREHVRLSHQYLGDLSLGPNFQRKLDEHSADMGPFHRTLDHTWERLNRMADLYGPVGYAEILIHIGADYGLVQSMGLLNKRRATIENIKEKGATATGAAP